MRAKHLIPKEKELIEGGPKAGYVEKMKSPKPVPMANMDSRNEGLLSSHKSNYQRGNAAARARVAKSQQMGR